MTFVSSLEPIGLWSHFDRLLTIPRGSKKEDQVRQHVIEVAESCGLACRRDAVGNIVVPKPASKGREGAPVVILQAHLDMVQEKNSDVEHDFDVDPIRPKKDGEYLTAQGTTLGSDNGIGVAAMLAILEDGGLEHGPLEMLFTIDEETGLTGAAGLGEDMLTGRWLINLDSEEEGVLTIGCAGGADSHLHLPLLREPWPTAAEAVSVRLHGLKGGHSGVDIHLQRGNAICLLARAILVAEREAPLRIAHFEGGNAHNAIPREASATILVEGDVERVKRTLDAELQSVREEFRAVEADLCWDIQATGASSDAWSAASTRTALALLNALPHGVLSMSREMEGLVETSTNLAVVKETGNRLTVLLSSRSSVMSALGALKRRIAAVAALAGCEVEEHAGYPSWKPNVESPLLGVVRRVHERIAGPAEIGAVHAGLECSIIAQKYPGMDMISFGPQIDYPHSPDERVKIPSVDPFYRVLLGVLAELARAP